MGLISEESKNLKRKYDSLEREIASEIIDIVEDKLAELEVDLPDKFKEGREDEAIIFGSNYFDLEDKITECIIENKE